MKKVAVIGTVGVPARYGGFETLVENIIGENASSDVSYTVFCSSRDCNPNMKEYKGAQLKYIPLRANGVQSIPYDILSLIQAWSGYDVVLVLGVSGCLFLPIFRLFFKGKLIVNIDGLEHRRAKWGRFARWFLRKSEAVAVRYADTVIADNKAIQDYVTTTYSRPSELIAYGGDHALCRISEEKQSEILETHGLMKGKYAFAVCRIEPENNSHLILESFARSAKKLVFVGNWDRSDYGRRLKSQYSDHPNIVIADPIYDLDTLHVLRKNALCYVHGHSAGGTNPSLVEAMFFGVPILAFDVAYNRETTGGAALYFSDADSLRRILESDALENASVNELLALARTRYRWKTIAEQYENLY